MTGQGVEDRVVVEAVLEATVEALRDLDRRLAAIEAAIARYEPLIEIARGRLERTGWRKKGN